MKLMFYMTSLDKGGAERVITNLANFFSSLNENEVVITLNTKKNIAYELNNNIEVLELDQTIKRDNFLKRNFTRLLNTNKIIKEKKPDVVIAFLPMPSFRVLLLKRKLNCKVIISDRNDPQKEYKSLFNKFMMKWLYKKADGFIFQTEEQKQYFNKKIQDKSIVIANPLKEEFLQECERENTEDVIINVGRLHPQKNQKLLIEAFYEVKDRFPNFKLKIFGEGKLKSQLEKQIKEMNLEKRVILCGITNNIREELLKSKLFIMTSNYEGMPNALLEAMACGVPCISTDCPCGGPKEVVRNNINGILFPVGNKMELIKVIEEVLSNDKKLKELGENAQNIRTKLDSKVVNEKWNNYIMDVIKNEK